MITKVKSRFRYNRFCGMKLTGLRAWMIEANARYDVKEGTA